MAEKHTADPAEIMRATGHPELEYAAGWTIAGLVTIGTIVAAWVFAIYAVENRSSKAAPSSVGLRLIEPPGLAITAGAIASHPGPALVAAGGDERIKNPVAVRRRSRLAVIAHH